MRIRVCDRWWMAFTVAAAVGLALAILVTLFLRVVAGSYYLLEYYPRPYRSASDPCVTPDFTDADVFVYPWVPNEKYDKYKQERNVVRRSATMIGVPISTPYSLVMGVWGMGMLFAIFSTMFTTYRMTRGLARMIRPVDRSEPECAAWNLSHARVSKLAHRLAVTLKTSVNLWWTAFAAAAVGLTMTVMWFSLRQPAEHLCFFLGKEPLLRQWTGSLAPESVPYWFIMAVWGIVTLFAIFAMIFTAYRMIMGLARMIRRRGQP